MGFRLGLALLLLALLSTPQRVAAGGFVFHFSGGSSAAAAGAFGGAVLVFGAAAAERTPLWRDEPAVLIVDATPLDAQVYLDGRRLGSAGELVALAVPVASGRHTVHVAAPGFRPSVSQFVADGSFPVRVRATLVRE